MASVGFGRGELCLMCQRHRGVRRRPLCILLLAVVSLAGCGESTADVQQSSTAELAPQAAAEPGMWTSLPESPLSPRHESLTGILGSGVLVVGGRNTPACPPGAACGAPAEPPLRDGAIFDPAAQTWTRIPDAPVPITGVINTAPTGTGVWSIQELDAKPVLVGYELAKGWRTVDIPEPSGSGRGVGVVGAKVLVYPSSRERGGLIPDRLYDPGTETWTELPVDPIGAAYDRTLVGIDDGVLLLAIPKIDVPRPDRPRVFHAARYNHAENSWRNLPASMIPGYADTWYRHESKIVNPTLGSVDGGTVDRFDRAYALGGVLDVDSQRWLALPPFEDLPVGSGSSPVAAGEDWVISSVGAVDAPLAALELETLAWRPLPTTPIISRTGVGRIVVGDRVVMWGGADFELPAPRGRLHDDGVQLRLR